MKDEQEPGARIKDKKIIFLKVRKVNNERGIDSETSSV
jgi:hypothetical protein